MYIERSSTNVRENEENGATDCVYIAAGVDNYLNRDPTGGQERRNGEV